MTFPTHIVAVGGIVKNHNNQILLVQTYNNGWVFPGGQVDQGENVIEALIREVKEESGIDITIHSLIGVYSNTSSYTAEDGVTHIPTKVIIDFVCESVGGELSNSIETSESRWIEIDEVLNHVTSLPVRSRFQVYLDHKTSPTYMEYITKPQFNIKLEREC